MSDESTVDSLVTGLVREFLFRRGLTNVLRTFDEETGYERGSALSSTRELVELLRLSTLYKRNAASGARNARRFARATSFSGLATRPLTRLPSPFPSQRRHSRAFSMC